MRKFWISEAVSAFPLKKLESLIMFPASKEDKSAATEVEDPNGENEIERLTNTEMRPTISRRVSCKHLDRLLTKKV